MLRFGTMLSLIRDVLGEPQSVFARRLNLPATTVTAYMGGMRFPRNDLPGVYQALRAFFQQVLAEIGIDDANVNSMLTSSLNVEKAYRRLVEINPAPFQRAATKLLVSMLRDENVDPRKTLESLLNGNGEKEQVAAYLSQMGVKGGFLSTSEEGYAKPARFFEMTERYNILLDPNVTMRFIASVPLSIDILMALPDRLEFTVDNNNSYHGNLRLAAGGKDIQVSMGELISIAW